MTQVLNNIHKSYIATSQKITVPNILDLDNKVLISIPLLCKYECKYKYKYKMYRCFVKVYASGMM